MPRIDLALLEWPDSPDNSPRLLGRLRDEDLVDEARRRLADHRRRELAALEPPVRLLDDEEDGR